MIIYWDRANRRVLSSKATGQDLQRLDLVLRDVDTLSVQLVEADATTGAYTATTVPTGWSVKFELKDTDARDADPAPAGAYTFTPTGTGESLYYEAELTLNTTEMIALVEAETVAYLDVVGELTLQDAELRNRDSTQFEVRVTEDVVRPSTSVSSAAAHFPWVRQVTRNGGRHLVFMNSDGIDVGVMSPPGVPYP